MIAAASTAAGKEIPFEVVSRRPGDASVVYADASRALDLLGWKAGRGLEEICADSWRWQRSNPKGFAR
jgi:UDP-glucose 4-epimerase